MITHTIDTNQDRQAVLQACIQLAQATYGTIHPCSNDARVLTWSECLTFDSAMGLVFWFNDQNNSTHCILVK
jgi:hypothetical protein